MALHYSGTFWAPPLQHLLDHEIEPAKPRLTALAQGACRAVRERPTMVGAPRASAPTGTVPAPPSRCTARPSRPIDLCLLGGPTRRRPSFDPTGGPRGEDPGAEHRIELVRDGHVWSTYVPGVGPGAALRLPGARPPAGRSGQAPRRSLRHRPRRSGFAGASSCSEPGRDSAGVVPHGDRHLAPLRVGRRPADPGSPGRTRSSTRPTSRVSPPATPRCPGRSGAPTGASPIPPCSTHLAGLGVTTVELLPVHHFVSEHTWRRAG